ncbi:Glycosyltransferase involved in cell wall bisynthesis [Mucilaginibacter gossypiicola]|uniref:Glycosyltransferase involved in cell wall bisynthesis n=2 Tax=Mucilaginibacter gossypiicola TaxID=551995 RepID=A0A1H8V492_9SPHI|nr:Glycosyltransferase involved in cell wall bisynthesis [Mucilaginibacter gossypiicola]
MIQAKFKQLQVCVIIPTYNNEGTLAAVITDVLAYTNQVIVVNDGSTDSTQAIIQSFPQIQSVSYTQNAGKGWALRKAFEFAIEQGYQHAITIDSDGQHFATDLPAFIEKLEQEPDSLIIGSRNMEQSSVPGKSSFGHKFSNFWFWVETGIKCPDTQSGYRLYPIHLLKNTKYVTRKYEFEIEVIVRAAWKGIKIGWVPVTVYYAPKETRISHFRPFQDFSRISVLNTILVIITFAYIKPRDFFRTLFDKKKAKQMLKNLFFNPEHSPQLKAKSVAFGVFMGIVPIWGFQLLVAISLAFLFRLNKAIVVTAAHISVAPMIPVIIFLSYKTGRLWMGGKDVDIPLDKISLKSIGEHLEQYLYGSISLAIFAGIIAGLLTFALLKLFKRRPVPAL